MKYMLLLYGPAMPSPGTQEAATLLDGKVEVRPLLQVRD